MRVRPRGLRYDPRGAVATTRRRTARTAQPDTTAGTGRAFGPTLGIGRDVPIARSSVRPVGFRRRAQFPQRAGCIRLHCNSVTWHCSSITHRGSVVAPLNSSLFLTSRRAFHALCCRSLGHVAQRAPARGRPRAHRPGSDRGGSVCRGGPARWGRRRGGRRLRAQPLAVLHERRRHRLLLDGHHLEARLRLGLRQGATGLGGVGHRR